MLSSKVDNELSEKIIGAFYKTYNALGFGYLEKVYLNALKYELNKLGLKVEIQKPIKVYYEGLVIGEYFADVMVNDRLIVELKAVAALTLEHESQLFNYLKATNTELGLLLNYGPKPEVRRKIWTETKKINPC
jgi:GxxExxY protein